MALFKSVFVSVLFVAIFSSCRIDPQQWLSKHLPAPQAYNAHEDIIVSHKQFFLANDGISIGTPPAIDIAIAFDARNKRVLNLLNLSDKASLSGPFYQKDASLDWFLSSDHLFAIDRQTGNFIARIIHLNRTNPLHFLGHRIEEGNRVLIESGNSTTHSFQVINLDNGTILAEWNLAASFTRSFDGVRYAYATLEQASGTVGTRQLVKFDLIDLTKTVINEVSLSNTLVNIPLADHFKINDESYFLSEVASGSLGLALNQNPELWQLDHFSNTFNTIIPIERPSSHHYLVKAFAHAQKIGLMFRHNGIMSTNQNPALGFVDFQSQTQASMRYVNTVILDNYILSQQRQVNKYLVELDSSTGFIFPADTKVGMSFTVFNLETEETEFANEVILPFIF